MRSSGMTVPRGVRFAVLSAFAATAAFLRLGRRGRRRAVDFRADLAARVKLAEDSSTLVEARRNGG